jgi:hypothetical protein
LAQTKATQGDRQGATLASADSQHIEDRNFLHRQECVFLCSYLQNMALNCGNARNRRREFAAITLRY